MKDASLHSPQDTCGPVAVTSLGCGPDIQICLVRPTAASASFAMPLLDGSERERASRYLRAQDRAAFVVTRAALRSALSQELHIPAAAIRFETSDLGKPAIAKRHQASGLSFSASHTDGLGVVAVVRGRAVGVDVENSRAIDDLDSIAAMTFDASVAAQLRDLAAAARTTAFLRCWTAGEAYGKATGLGIAGLGGRFPIAFSGPSSDICIPTGPPARRGYRWSVAPLEVGPHHVATLVYEALPGERPRIRFLHDNVSKTA